MLRLGVDVDCAVLTGCQQFGSAPTRPSTGGKKKHAPKCSSWRPQKKEVLILLYSVQVAPPRW